jgi:choline kinase
VWIRRLLVDEGNHISAGKGSRIGGISGKSKCLLEIAGTSILENALTCFSKERFQEVILVVGYQAELVRQFGDNFRKMKLIYINNPDYKTTNTMYSLYLARQYLYQEFVFLKGDSFFEQCVLQRLLKGAEDCSAADNFKDFVGVMPTVADTARITQVETIREISTFPGRYKSAGIIKISSELGTKLASWLSEDVEKGYTHIYHDPCLPGD